MFAFLSLHSASFTGDGVPLNASSFASRNKPLLLKKATSSLDTALGFSFLFFPLPFSFSCRAQGTEAERKPLDVAEEGTFPNRHCTLGGVVPFFKVSVEALVNC